MVEWWGGMQDIAIYRAAAPDDRIDGLARLSGLAASYEGVHGAREKSQRSSQSSQPALQ